MSKVVTNITIRAVFFLPSSLSHVTHLNVSHQLKLELYFLPVLLETSPTSTFSPSVFFILLHEVCAHVAFHFPCCPSTCMFHHPLCVSVPPHDVKRMAWNSTGNSSCPDSDQSQSSIPSAPLGGSTVATNSNTKLSKSTFL